MTQIALMLKKITLVLTIVLAVGLKLVGWLVRSVSEQALNGLLVLLFAQSRVTLVFPKPRKTRSP